MSGGVGGARMARGLAAVCDPDDLTVVVNVGDDEEVYGVYVAPDLDTVVYTLAGIEGPAGWGVARDAFTVMDHLDALGPDTTFRIGDRDLATNLYRSALLRAGEPLSAATRAIASAFGVAPTVLPASDDPVRTTVRTPDGTVLSFQDYFVRRQHRDEVSAVEFTGVDDAAPAPGVLDAIGRADLVVIAPSNPPLSIWPMLAVPGIRDQLRTARVTAVSPLFGGKALKGPADRVMASLGLPPGNAGVVAAYEGLVSRLVVDETDRADTTLAGPGLAVDAAPTRIADPAAAARFATWLLETS